MNIDILRSPTCEKHGSKWWVESVPKGHGYCQRCAQEDYPNAKLGDMTGDAHNGAGAYDSDLDFSL